MRQDEENKHRASHRTIPVSLTVLAVLMINDGSLMADLLTELRYLFEDLDERQRRDWLEILAASETIRSDEMLKILKSKRP